MSGFNIHVEIVKAGQPRAYADSVYEAILTFSNTWDSTTGPRHGTWEPTEAQIKEVVRLFVRNFDEDIKHPMASRLKTLERIEHRMWRAVVVEPY